LTNVGIGTTTNSYKLHVAGDIYANGGWLRVSGTNGLYFESYGGGWFMNDNTWIRSYSNKNVWTDTGIIATNGGFSAGSSTTPPVGGAMIVGNTIMGSQSSPLGKLDVVSTSAGSTVINARGVAGNLFSVTDSLSGSLFSVNTAAGFPVMEAFSDSRVNLGQYNQNDLVVTGNRVGIGTAAPTHKLHVSSSGTPVKFEGLTSSSTGYYLTVDNTSGIVYKTSTGPQGAQGAVGATGAQGDKGATGAQGDKGATGAQGDKGATGSQGAVGSQGAKGATGSQGAGGTNGVSGAQGAKGSTGAQGASGTSGRTDGLQTSNGAATGAMTVDLSQQITQWTLSGNVTSIAHSNAKASGTVNNWILAVNSTSSTITWPSTYKWPGGVAPTITSTASRRDLFQFISYDGASTSTGTVHAMVIAQNITP